MFIIIILDADADLATVYDHRMEVLGNLFPAFIYTIQKYYYYYTKKEVRSHEITIMHNLVSYLYIINILIFQHQLILMIIIILSVAPHLIIVILITSSTSHYYNYLIILVIISSSSSSLPYSIILITPYSHIIFSPLSYSLLKINFLIMYISIHLIKNKFLVPTY
jgi:hypothetical protein